MYLNIIGFSKKNLLFKGDLIFTEKSNARGFNNLLLIYNFFLEQKIYNGNNDLIIIKQ